MSFGDPDSVSALATHMAGVSVDFVGTGQDIQANNPAWQGLAADAFDAAKQCVAADLFENGALVSDGATAIQQYSAELQRLNDAYEEARARWQAASDRVRANPLDIVAHVETFAANASAAAVTVDWGHAGIRCGATLAQLAGEIRFELTATADLLDGLFDDPEANRRVPNGELGDDQFDPDSLRQGAVGDCFLLAEINALLLTDEGKDWLKKQIRWDADAGGYWVTLYENGEPVEVFVQGTYAQGVDGGDGMASLYESAARQRFGWDGVNGGWPADAYEWLTGTKGKAQDPITDDVRQDMSDTLANGGQVVVASHEGSFGDDKEYDLTATRVNPDGTTEEFEARLAAPHAYTVEKVDANGDVWIRNPWGEGNSYDGGGVFKVSKADFDAVFWQATTSQLPD